MESSVPIYLDNAATTRVLPGVFEAMKPYFGERYGNAASRYYEAGRQAAAALEKAREEIAGLINARPDEIYFTAGATESSNWVLQSLLLGAQKKHVIVSAIEHHSVLEPVEALAKLAGVEATLLPVDGLGRVDPAALDKAIRPDTALVSVMHANNEIGTVQPIAELAAVARAKGVPFHTDACQTVGKIPVDVQALGIDLLSLSGHKFHAPKGIGALWLRKGQRLRPLLHGGGQERNRRAGTSNVAGAVGLGAAAVWMRARLAEYAAHEIALVERLWRGLEAAIPKIRRNGDPSGRVPGILNVAVQGAEGEAILGYLDMMGVMASSGSACTSGSLDPSHVLLAVGLPAEVAHGSIRFSLSGETTEAEIDRVIATVPGVVERLRAMSPTWKG